MDCEGETGTGVCVELDDVCVELGCTDGVLLRVGVGVRVPVLVAEGKKEATQFTSPEQQPLSQEPVALAKLQKKFAPEQPTHALPSQLGAEPGAYGHAACGIGGHGTDWLQDGRGN